jgi:hypothetical protein
MKGFATARAHGVTWECLLLMVAMLSVFVLTHSGFTYAEAINHYTVAEHIVKHRELGFPYAMEGIFSVAPNGRTYASHEIGNALFLLPVALLNHGIEARLTPVIGPERVQMVTRFLFASMGAILCAAGAVFLYLILRLVFVQPTNSALVSVLLFSFCSYYWTYSRIIFDGVLCAVLLLAAMLFLFLFARTQRTQLLVAAFACLGFGFITRLSMLLVIVAAGGYLLLVLRVRPDRLWRTAFVAGLTLAPFVVWQLYYNHLRTGSALVPPVFLPQYAESNAMTGSLLTGLAGLLLSPGKSIFIYCPPALLSVLLIRRFWRAYPNEGFFVVSLGLLWLFLHARMASWYGAWGWGPRLFVTVSPVLALPFLVQRFSLKSRPARAFASVLLLFGFLLASASIIGNWHYRLFLANQDGRADDRSIVWSLDRNQAVDQLAGAARNLRQTFFGGDFAVVRGASPLDIAASNTLNLWLFTAHRQRIPAILLVTAGGALATCACTCFWLLLKVDPT